MATEAVLCRRCSSLVSGVLVYCNPGINEAERTRASEARPEAHRRAESVSQVLGNTATETQTLKNGRDGRKPGEAPTESQGACPYLTGLCTITLTVLGTGYCSSPRRICQPRAGEDRDKNTDSK